LDAHTEFPLPAFVKTKSAKEEAVAKLDLYQSAFVDSAEQWQAGSALRTVHAFTGRFGAWIGEYRNLHFAGEWIAAMAA
jgi:pullulanase/glycogen debranching enzyme